MPSAASLDEDERSLSPTSPSHKYFFFHDKLASPTAFAQKFFANHSTPTSAFQQAKRGYLYDEHQRSTHTKNQLCKTLVCLTMVWLLGAMSWNTLQARAIDTKQQQQQDEFMNLMTTVLPPPNSPSELARQAFVKNYGVHPHKHHIGPHDWNAHPPLYVILESSIQDGLHSFTDDTSVAYQEGKQYCMGLSQHLSKQFSAFLSARVTSYYSLLDGGLDYVAKNMVTPDGSKTMIQIQFVLSHEHEMERAVKQLQQLILDYGTNHAPTYLQTHYTGLNWNPKDAKATTNLHRHNKKHDDSTPTGTWKAYAAVGVAVVVTAMLFGSLLATTDDSGATFVPSWILWMVVSTATSVSVSAMALAYVLPTSMTTTSSLGLVVAVLVSFGLSLYYSKLQMDHLGNNKREEVTVPSILMQDASLLLSFVASLYMVPSVAVKSMSLGATTAVLFTTLYHVLVARHYMLQSMTHLMKEQQAMNGGRRITSPISRSNSPTNSSSTTKTGMLRLATILSIILGTFSLALATTRNNTTNYHGGMHSTTDQSTAINPQFHDFGEHFGYGRLTPYRILFDGHKSGQSMITLAGYDIVQTIIDELQGIYIPDDASTSKDDLDEDMMIPAGSGSTHIAEEATESQHLIKRLVDTLHQFKAKQQKEFDRHHQRRQEKWEKHMEEEFQQQLYDEKAEIEGRNLFQEDKTLDYNVNSGIDATTYTGLAVLENSRIPQSLYNAANICRGMEPKCPSEALHLLNVIEDETTTSDKLATYITVNLGVDPFSKKGMEWLELARETVRRVGADPRIVGGVEIYIDGPAAILYDHLQQENQEQSQQDPSHDEDEGNTSSAWCQVCKVLGFLLFALGARTVVLSRVDAGSRKPRQHLHLQPLDTHLSVQQDAYLAQYDKFDCSHGAP